MSGTSLSDLRDIALPAEPGLWPPAPGMWLLLSILFSILLVLCWSLLERRKRNAYRRAGILLLGGVETLYDLSVLLKRVALAVFPRAEVAPLHGPDWVRFLGRTCPGVDLTPLGAGNGTGPVDASTRQAAARWIRNHRTGPGQPEEGK